MSCLIHSTNDLLARTSGCCVLRLLPAQQGWQQIHIICNELDNQQSSIHLLCPLFSDCSSDFLTTFAIFAKIPIGFIV